MPDTITLPNAAYAVGTLLPHHNAEVTKPTENATVDMDMLKDCLTKVLQTDMPQADREAALSHLKAHALALDMEDEEVTELIGDAEAPPDYPALIEAVDSFVKAEDLLLAMVEAEVDDALLDAAYAKVIDLAKVDREVIAEEFEGVLIDKPTQDEDGLWHFTARVAQADKVNKNKRLYPKAEFENNLPRVNRLCRAGRFTGRDGHAYWSDDKPSEICVRYDAVSLQEGDLIMEGVLIPTQAGQNIATLWNNGVQTEWSIVGYGKPEYKQDEKGNFTHTVITDYILDGCDPVRRGAASTRTLKVTKPKDGLEAEGEEIQAEAVEEQVEDLPSVPAEEPTMGEELKNDVVEDKAEEKPDVPAPAPQIDMDAIVQAAMDKVGESAAKVAAEAAVQAAKAYHEGQQKAQALQGAKDAAIAALAATDKDLATIVSRHFDDCADADAVAAKVEEITPLVQSMKKKMEVATVGIHSKSEKEVGWFNGTRLTDRPETTYEVVAGLMDGIEDTGVQSPSNPAWGFRQMLENYEKHYPQYLHACTKRGFMETATTSTALGTTLPYVLPLIRQVWPKMIAYDLQSVQPLNGPDGRVYFLDFQYGSGDSDGSNMDDSSVFDTSYVDHTEGETKAQIKLAFSHTNIEAEEKSMYYDITSVLMQDMRALYNLDAEAELLQAAASHIAREINLKYLETIAAGAGLDAGTYGTTKPTNWDSQEKWYDQGLSMWVNYAGSLIGKKFYQEADWMFCSPTQAQLFASTNKWESDTTDVNQFGFGIRKEGVYRGKLTIYSVSWGEALTSVKNKMVFGFRPPDWKYTGAVFAPYVPLYISPQDSDASRNTLSRAVSSRNAMAVLQANAFSTMTIADADGTEVPFVD